MSKIKVNNSQLKNCILAIKNNKTLSITKKDTILLILNQFLEDKKDGVYSDGKVKGLVFDCANNLKNNTKPTEDIVADLMDIYHNLSKRMYCLSDEEDEG